MMAVAVTPAIAETATYEPESSESYSQDHMGVTEKEMRTTAEMDRIMTPQQFRSDQDQAWEDFQRKQSEESQEFFNTLNDIPMDARQTAINEHFQEQLHDRIAELENHHGRYMDYLQKQLRQVPDLTKSEREDIINFFEKQNEENIAFLRKQYRQNNDFFDDIGDEYRPTSEQQAKIKEFLAAQREQDVKHFNYQEKQNVDKISRLYTEGLDRQQAHKG
jgi:hypothetical protein